MRMEMARAKQRSDRYVSARVPAKISSVHPRNAALAHLLARRAAQRRHLLAEGLRRALHACNHADGRAALERSRRVGVQLAISNTYYR